MKKSAILSVLALCCASAQGVEPWSLDSCINYAVEHNISVKQSKLQHYNGELELTEAKDAFLPTVQGYASESFSFGRGLTADNTYANRNTSSTSLGASLNLPLFQGLRATRRVAQAKANLAQLLEQTEATKDNITLRVIAQYLQVLYTRELVDVAENQINISKLELERQQTLFDNGKIPELDLTQAASQVAQDELSAVSARGDARLALIDLAQLLELDMSSPEGQQFDVCSLDTTATPSIPDVDEVWARAQRRNHAIEAARLGVVTADKSVSLAKAGYLPTLSFSAGLGSSYYSMKGARSESFGQQMKHNFNQSIGFSLSVPIFDAFSTRNNVRRAKANRLNAELSLEQTRTETEKAIVQAHTQAITARQRMEASAVARRQAEAAMLAVKEKYNFGRATPTEFETAKNTYYRASSEAVQARYEHLLRIRILEFYAR